MNADQEMTIKQHCRDLVAAFAQHLDHQEFDKAIDLFTTDGTWMRGDKPLVGREAMRGAFANGGKMIFRHLSANTVVEVADDDHATAITYYVAYSHNPGAEAPKYPVPLTLPFSVGEWHDSFVRAQQGWRFATRDTVRVFQRPAQNA